MSAPKASHARLRKEYARLKKSPIPYITAEPLASNILEWRYCLRGPQDSPFEGGYYHGKIVFPSQYPLKPPSVYILTPNGRFKTGTRLCLSNTDFHAESWSPAWDVGSILNGLLSFMLENQATTGSIESSKSQKMKLAIESHAHCLKDPLFRDLFPDVIEEIKEKYKCDIDTATNSIKYDDDALNPVNSIKKIGAATRLGSTSAKSEIFGSAIVVLLVGIFGFIVHSMVIAEL
eukprot:Clim_evm69s25 gene=Clim_evmTU69s25